jgi:hypothetical protein
MPRVSLISKDASLLPPLESVFVARNERLWQELNAGNKKAARIGLSLGQKQETPCPGKSVTLLTLLLLQLSPGR